MMQGARAARNRNLPQYCPLIGSGSLPWIVHGVRLLQSYQSTTTLILPLPNLFLHEEEQANIRSLDYRGTVSYTYNSYSWQWQSQNHQLHRLVRHIPALFLLYLNDSGGKQFRRNDGVII
eukprot:scaffold114268_cov37-Cyclotella_meneghiniana.AAC.5